MATAFDAIARLEREIDGLRGEVSRLQREIDDAKRDTGAERTYAAPSTRRDTSSKTSRNGDKGDESDFSYLMDRKADEASRFFRGIILASLEGVRVATDSVASFVDEAMNRNVPKENESATDVARRLPSDLTRGIVQGIDDAMDIPSAAIDKFDEVYHRQSGRITQRRSRATRPPTAEERRSPEPVNRGVSPEPVTRGVSTEASPAGREDPGSSP
jgi:hypothetical protein